MQGLFVVLFMVGLAIVPTVMAYKDWRDWYWLYRYGAEMNAEIQHHWVGYLGSIPNYYVIYDIDGETPDGDYFFHSRFTEISREAYQGIEGGEPLRVRYCTLRPFIHRPAGQAPQVARWTLTSLFAWAVALFFLYLLLM